MTLDDAHDALTNWGHWCRRIRECYPDGVGCGSIESHYSSPQIWHPPGPRLKINERQAETIEKLVHETDFPALWRVICKVQYVTHTDADLRARGCYRASYEPIRARAAKVAEPTYLEQLQEARWHIADLL